MLLPFTMKYKALETINKQEQQLGLFIERFGHFSFIFERSPRGGGTAGAIKN